MTSLSLIKKVAFAAVALVGIAAASPAHATSYGNWNGTANGPTIYQTNWEYDSTWITPPSGIPSGATIYNVSWVINLSYYPSLTYGYLNSGSGTYYGPLPSISGSGGLGSNISANQNFRFAFYVSQSTTHTLSPAVVGGGQQLTVAYQY